MAGRVPAIHVFLAIRTERTWMPGTRPGMTSQAGSDLFVFPGAAEHPFVASCTSAIRSRLLPERPEFRKLSGSPPLTIVRPCFGQNCIECLAGVVG
jgi:hypothetical protein